MKRLNYQKIIKEALLEDMPYGDITSNALKISNKRIELSLLAKSKGVFAGKDIFNEVFMIVDADVDINWKVNDGDTVEKGTLMAKVSGLASSIVKGERLALNFVQRMSGIATLTREYVDATRGYSTKVVDTRKTTPLLRLIEKEAVRIGGGYNHRMNLSDAVMIKDNHIVACGGVKEAITRAKDYVGHTVKIEVEVESIESVIEAIDARADIIMLDNMSNEMIKEALTYKNDNFIFEASGNMTVERTRELAKMGVDVVSVGAITYNAPVLDISLKEQEGDINAS